MNQRIALIIGTVALLLGGVGPWVSALGVVSVGPTQTLEGGLVVFGGIALLILFTIIDKAHRSISITVGALALSEAIYMLVNIQQAKADAKEWGALFSPGWGLYLTIIAGLYLIASTFIVKKSIKPAPSTLLDDVPGSVPPPHTVS